MISGCLGEGKWRKAVLFLELLAADFEGISSISRVAVPVCAPGSVCTSLECGTETCGPPPWAA